jgi:shikimate kinase
MEIPSNIFLVGFMGAGKTSTGKELSKILSYQFLDMDSWIEEKNGQKISEIFEKHGEGFFRNEEKEAIKGFVGKSNYVVSTGGGTWIDKENRENLFKLGWCVWLKVTPEDMWQRVSSHLGQRPLLLKSKNPQQYLTALLKQRTPFYSLAHAGFETDKKTPKEIALDIIEVLKKDRPFEISAAKK